MKEYHIAWWNLENLFDSVNSPHRPAWLKDSIKGELKGWTTTIVNKKIHQLATIINGMNGGQGPDILGVCEVENAHVLGKLVKKLHSHRRYSIAHHDMSDHRGIDVAFIYDADLFTVEAQFNHVVLKRNATRDLFQVNFTTNQGNALVCIGNHWPSRTGGQAQSEPYRQMAGETLAYWHERIRSIKGADTPIVVMGDLNDEPFDSSVINYALAERTLDRVVSKRSRKPYLFNLMWELMGEGKGTHFYQEWGMLDQILVNRSLLTNDGPFKLVDGSIAIHKLPIMLKGGRPRRFGRTSNRRGIDNKGYSDHLPIEFQVRETI